MSSRELVPAQPAALAMPARGQAVALVGEASREWARVRGMMEVARDFPRDEGLARAEIKAACMRPEFADVAAYEYERGGKPVTGASVYLAKEMGRCWGHMIHGTRVLEDDGESVHGESWAHDLQRNIYVSKQFKVRKLVQRKVRDARGQAVRDQATGRDATQWIVPDERDLFELVNRVAAKTVRNAILDLLPDDLKDAALRWADEGLAQAAAAPPAAGAPAHEAQPTDVVASGKLNGLVVSYARLGVTLPMLEAHLGHEIDAMTVAEYVGLVKLGTAIKENRTSVEEAFGGGVPPAEAQAEDDDPFGSLPPPVATLDDLVRRERGQ